MTGSDLYRAQAGGKVVFQTVLKAKGITDCRGNSQARTAAPALFISHPYGTVISWVGIPVTRIE